MATSKRRRKQATKASLTTSKRVKTESNALPSANLLSIAIELRTCILEDLLKSEEPIFFQPDRTHSQLWPAILQKCKQLHDEGDPILYSNSIGASVEEHPKPIVYRAMRKSIAPAPRQDPWAHKAPATATVFAQDHGFYGVLQGTLPRAMNKFSHITIYVRPHESKEGLRRGIELLTKTIDRHENWRQLKIVFEIKDNLLDKEEDYRASQSEIYASGPPGTNPQYLSSYILQPLARLRHRQTITCFGIQGSAAQRLQNCIEKSGPVLHLDETLGELEKYCLTITKMITTCEDDAYEISEACPYNFLPNDNEQIDDGLPSKYSLHRSEIDVVLSIRQRLRGGCRPAAVAEDSDRFFRQRHLVLRMTSLLNHLRVLAVHQQDPDKRDTYRLTIEEASESQAVPLADQKAGEIPDLKNLRLTMDKLASMPFR